MTAIVRAKQAAPVHTRPLKPPAGHRYPDTFYVQVAERYRAAQRAGTGRRAPVQAIADEAGVPRTTAARWVKEARARGKLPDAPGQGKVSDA
ncbi:MAG TPA: helix-turn-helix domain-containing protein [Gaiellaceae bacterium]|nr:helix-turn-helix domain-containing protein [Gaiellaceae bacterium]